MEAHGIRVSRTAAIGLRQHFQRLFAPATLCLLLAIPSLAEAAQKLNGHVPSAISKLASTGRPAPAKRLNLAIGLPLRNQDGLATLHLFLRLRVTGP
jgi:hypothetical protein